MKTQNVYIELDVLLDTRIGTIAKISEDLAVEVLSNGYRKRTTDIFSTMSTTLKDSTYKEAYGNRDISVLKYSYITNMPFSINKALESISKSSVGDPTITAPIIMLNLYPYKFNVLEKEQLTLTLQALFGISVVINYLYMSPKQVSPSFIKQTLSMVFMYDFIKWFDIHNVKLLDITMPDVELLVPKISFRSTDEMSEYRDDDEIPPDISPYDATAITLLGHVSIQFLDISNYCILKH